MKKKNNNLTAVGFVKEEKPGLMYLNRFNEYEPFEKKGKLGVRYKDDKRIVIDADFTFIEAFSIDYDVFFKVGNEGKFGLYYKDCEIIPVQYARIVQNSDTPKIFFAYDERDENQFDVYWQKGMLAKECTEIVVDDFNVKVKYTDESQELFHFIGDYETNVIIERGKHDIQLYNGYIIVDDGKPVVYNYKGCKVSEDVSGRYVPCVQFLVHITETDKKFYNDDGKEVDLYKTFEDVVMADEYVLGKYRGHWRILYSV